MASTEADIALQTPNSTFHLSVVADGRTKKVELWTKLDKTLPKSIISKEKAGIAGGATQAVLSNEQLKDSDGVTYQAHLSMRLRCECHGSGLTFHETFYIVENCQFGAMLRKDISKDPLKDDPGCHMLCFKTGKRGKRCKPGGVVVVPY